VHWGVLLTSTAATLAAVLAGINLHLTGRRESVNWRRSVLERTFVDFLTASYNHRGACKHLAYLRDGHPSERTEDQLKEAAYSAHQILNDMTSRMRILAGSDITEVAIKLHKLNDEDMDLLVNGGTTEFLRLRPTRSLAYAAARDEFVDEAQKYLHLKGNRR
jgi:hypothetical protein